MTKEEARAKARVYHCKRWEKNDYNTIDVMTDFALEAIEAERRRIVERLEAQWVGDGDSPQETAWNDAIDRAIEIVRGEL